jgi:dihydroorotase
MSDVKEGGPLILEGMLADIDGVRPGQVCVEQGQITAVGAGLGRADYVFDEGCLIFAGFGDIHVHARQDASGLETYKETFATAAAAALHGGVVHIADMPNNPRPPTDDITYAEKEELARGLGRPVTITLYAGIGPGTRPLSRPVPYKVYMGPSVGQLYFSSTEELEQVLAAYRGQTVSFHCEDPELLARHRTAATHEARRPPECELRAVQTALELIEKYNLRGNLCHLSLAESVAAVRAARARGLSVTAEVTPHHLFFDASMLHADRAPWLQVNPPLRSPADRQALLEALRTGDLDYLATDHAPHTPEEKLQGRSGMPHLDTYGPFVAWLLREQGFSAERLAAVCAANPGAFVHPFQKERYGRLLPGYVGSLTVLDLRHPRTIRREELRTRCGWSPFEGVTFPGQVAAVFVRGRLVGGSHYLAGNGDHA